MRCVNSVSGPNRAEFVSTRWINVAIVCFFLSFSLASAWHHCFELGTFVAYEMVSVTLISFYTMIHNSVLLPNERVNLLWTTSYHFIIL